MKVKVTSRTVTSKGAHKPGDEIEVTDRIGKSLIDSKLAEAVESTKKTKAESAAKEK